MRAECDTLFRHFAQLAKAENLKSARVGENGARPSHKRMQPAKVAYLIDPWPEVKVISISQQNFDAKLFEHVLGDALHRRRGADRHENRGLNLTVRSEQPAAAGRITDGIDLNMREHRLRFYRKVRQSRKVHTNDGGGSIAVNSQSPVDCNFFQDQTLVSVFQHPKTRPAEPRRRRPYSSSEHSQEDLWQRSESQQNQNWRQ